MNTYEKCQTIRRVVVNKAAEVMTYNWDADFAVKELRNLPDKIGMEDRGKELFDIQPKEMTEEQLEELGFLLYSEEDPIRLIPLWLFPFLAEKIETKCIDGKKLYSKYDMDTDNRFGCLAYGIYPEK